MGEQRCPPLILYFVSFGNRALEGQQTLPQGCSFCLTCSQPWSLWTTSCPHSFGHHFGGEHSTENAFFWSSLQILDMVQQTLVLLQRCSHVQHPCVLSGSPVAPKITEIKNSPGGSSQTNRQVIASRTSH